LPERKSPSLWSEQPFYHPAGVQTRLCCDIFHFHGAGKQQKQPLPRDPQRPTDEFVPENVDEGFPMFRIVRTTFATRFHSRQISECLFLLKGWNHRFGSILFCTHHLSLGNNTAEQPLLHQGLHFQAHRESSDLSTSKQV
jgi:hypothetical protein